MASSNETIAPVLRAGSANSKSPATPGPLHRRNVSGFITAVFRAVMPLIASIESVNIELIPRRRQGIIIVANHRSLLDLIVGLIVFRRWHIFPYVFIREDLFRNPVAGWLLRSIGGIPAGPESGAAAMRQGLRVLSEGGILMIMPEGRVPTELERIDGLGRLMPGVGRLAATMGTPVLLVGLANTDIAWPLGSVAPRFHIRRSRRPHIMVSADWLPVARGARGGEVMTAIKGGLRSILRQLDE